MKPTHFLRLAACSVIAMTQSVAMYSQNASSAPDWMGELSKRITLNGYAQAGYAYQDQPNAETSDFNLKRTLLWAKADVTDCEHTST
ncbi:MAG: hypothetical protein IJ139_05965, partial [Bacteroidaceae bacterium]|nr:hypothetical protein [Bacteroidaceae bacterium]